MLAAEGHVSQNPAVSYYLRDRNMLLDNISNTVQVFLGTQIGCAQCHDHPYEDWTQKSYYSLAAFAGNIDYRPHSAEMKVKSAVKYLAKKEGIPYVEPIKNQSLLSKEERRQHKQELSKFKKFSKTTGRNLRSLFSNYQKNEVFLNTSKTLKLPHDYQYNEGLLHLQTGSLTQQTLSSQKPSQTAFGKESMDMLLQNRLMTGLIAHVYLTLKL